MKKKCNLFIGFVLAITSLCAQPAMGQNLPTVKAAEFTDAQILDLLSQAQAAGLGVEQAEKLAISKGMPASEAQAFKDRLNKVQAKAPSNAATPALASEETAEAKGKQALVEAATPITGSEIVAPKAEIPVTVYGQELFRKGDLKIYERSIDAKAPANYELGVGDELGISIFGVSYYNTVAKVDSRGRIELGQLGSIYVKGVPFDRAKILIKTALSNNFNMSSNQVEISLAYSRSITVNIVGEVFKPGSYKIPALNTAFNALIAAGGPTDIGTLRNIQLRRNGKVIKTFDVYAYLQNPGSDDDFFLQDNDYLVIGTVGKLVSIAGAVKRPMTYELLPGEELAKLIHYAGDLNANSLGRSMVLQRYIDKNLRLFPLNWDSLSALKTDYVLVDGDQVTIPVLNTDVENRVEIKGPVYFPGAYALKGDERISDLIAKAGGLREQILLKRAYLIRTEKDDTRKYIPINIQEILNQSNSEDNILLKKNDVLLLYSEADFLNRFTVTTNGEVKRPATFPFKEDITLGDVLVLSGGLQISAEITKIEISRSNIFSPNYVPGEEYKSTSISLTIPKDVTDSSTILNTPLLPFDIVSVRRIPNFELQKLIELRGEFKYPGFYVIQDKGWRVQDVVAMAGGVTKYAFIKGARFDRPNIPGGYMVFNMKKAMNSKNSPYNYILEDSDVITLPKMIEFVSIYGSAIQYLDIADNSVMNAPFIARKRAGYYIRTFGNGYTSDAWRSKTYVLEANGRVRKTTNLYLFRITPRVRKGSTIHVVPKLIKFESMKSKIKSIKEKTNRLPTDWNRVIADITTKLTGFGTLWALLKK